MRVVIFLIFIISVTYQLDLKAKTLAASKNKYYLMQPNQSPIAQSQCPCESSAMSCPQCGADGNPGQEDCPCASGKPVCPPCIIAKAVKQMHEIAENQV